MDVRFHILDEHVDKFIVTESKYSHSGKLKPLNFDINNFPKFKDKIQYLVIENEPEAIDKNPNISSSVKRMNSLLRIEQSYNFMLNALENVSDDDLIFLSDNDEIPNLNSKDFKSAKNDIFIFKQLFFYYKFNLFYDLMPWYGTKACKLKDLKNIDLLRTIKNKKYPFYRVDTLFSDIKYQSVNLVKFVLIIK